MNGNLVKFPADLFTFFLAVVAVLGSRKTGAILSQNLKKFNSKGLFFPGTWSAVIKKSDTQSKPQMQKEALLDMVGGLEKLL